MARKTGASLLLAVAAAAILFSGVRPVCFTTPQALVGRTHVPSCQVLVKGAARQGLREGCRNNGICMRAVALIFGTSSGNTEQVAEMIEEETGLESVSIDDVDVESLKDYDGLIVGTPTWNTGADEDRTGVGWDAKREEIKALALGGKPVAVFGLGDSGTYPENFCEGLEEVHAAFKTAGGKMLGYVDPDNYNFETSKSVVDGKFVGLPLDQDNEADETEGRVKEWVAQLKAEGMPL